MFLYLFIYIHTGLKFEFRIDYSVVINIILNGLTNFYNIYHIMKCVVPRTIPIFFFALFQI